MFKLKIVCVNFRAMNKPNRMEVGLNNFKMINFELRSLKVGDFTWIAKHRSTGEELILPYIVERKRMDDLAKSIKDGRFHEQKFRLNNCGIPNIIYLVENCKDSHRGFPISTLMQAVTNTRIQNGFAPHFTSSLSDSIKFLAMMTKNLQEKYEVDIKFRIFFVVKIYYNNFQYFHDSILHFRIKH